MVTSGGKLVRRPTVAAVAAASFLAVGVASVVQAAWIPAKAALAQVLLERAWERARAVELSGDPEGPGAMGEALRPWPGADTRPVARLTFPERGESLLVLAGASGRTLAFGPGHLDGTPLPGRVGNSVVAGHRDTHFAVLEEVEVGEPLLVEEPSGAVRGFRVTSATVVHEGDTRALRPAGSGRLLTLVTCWPFDAVDPGGPLRYVVRAVEDGDRWAEVR